MLRLAIVFTFALSLTTLAQDAVDCFNHPLDKGRVFNFLDKITLCQSAENNQPIECAAKAYDLSWPLRNRDIAHLCQKAKSSQGPIGCFKEAMEKNDNRYNFKQLSQLCSQASDNSPVTCANQAIGELGFSRPQAVVLCARSQSLKNYQCAKKAKEEITQLISHHYIAQLCSVADDHF